MLVSGLKKFRDLDSRWKNRERGFKLKYYFFKLTNDVSLVRDGQ